MQYPCPALQLHTYLWLLLVRPLLPQHLYSDSRVLGADEAGGVAEVLKAHVHHTEVCQDVCGETSNCEEPVTKTTNTSKQLL